MRSFSRASEVLASWRSAKLARYVIEQQIAERRERAAAAIAKVLDRPGKNRTAIIGSNRPAERRTACHARTGLFENYCSVPGLRRQYVGTCKHIEACSCSWQRYGRCSQSASLHGLALPSPCNTEKVRSPFDAPSAKPSTGPAKSGQGVLRSAGLLRAEHYRSFASRVGRLRQADMDAVVLQRRVWNTWTGRMNSPRGWIWNTNSWPS